LEQLITRKSIGSKENKKKGVRPHFKYHFKYKHLHHLLSDLNNGTNHGLLAPLSKNNRGHY
jgi:hypothetical protein